MFSQHLKKNRRCAGNLEKKVVLTHGAAGATLPYRAGLSCKSNLKPFLNRRGGRPGLRDSACRTAAAPRRRSARGSGLRSSRGHPQPLSSRGSGDRITVLSPGVWQCLQVGLELSGGQPQSPGMLRPEEKCIQKNEQNFFLNATFSATCARSFFCYHAILPPR